MHFCKNKSFLLRLLHKNKEVITISNSISEEDKKNLITRLRRIEGQIRGLQRMIDEEKYCVDILTQIAASRGALKNVGLKVLQRHVEGCVSDAIQNGNTEEGVDLERSSENAEKFVEDDRDNIEEGNMASVISSLKDLSQHYLMYVFGLLLLIIIIYIGSRRIKKNDHS